MKYDLSRNDGLRWPFECWDDHGKVHIHWANWFAFKNDLEVNGEYKHNWLHRRRFIALLQPRMWMHDIVGIPSPYKIDTVEDDWSVIYEPFPYHYHGNFKCQPGGEGWFLWIEDKHPSPTLGEPVVLMSNGKTLREEGSYMIAMFRNQYWQVVDFEDYGLGPNRPSDEEKNRLQTAKKPKYRSIDDE